MVQTYFQLRFMFRNINDLRFGEPQDIQELRHEITVWQRAASSLSSYSKDEDLVRETLVKKVNRLQRQLKKKVSSGSVPVDSYKQTLQDLQRKVPMTFSIVGISQIESNLLTYFLLLFLVSDSESCTFSEIGCGANICD